MVRRRGYLKLTTMTLWAIRPTDLDFSDVVTVFSDPDHLGKLLKFCPVGHQRSVYCLGGILGMSCNSLKTTNSSNSPKFIQFIQLPKVAPCCQNLPKICVPCVRLKCVSSSSQVSGPPHQTYRCRANSGKPSIGKCNEPTDNRVFVPKSTNIQIIWWIFDWAITKGISIFTTKKVAAVKIAAFVNSF